MARLTSSDITLFLIPDSAYAVVGGQPVIDLGALGGGGATTTDNVTNDSTLVPNGGTLTAALDGADTRITAAQSTASAAGVAATAAAAVAAGAQTTANNAASAASAAQTTANGAASDAAAAQADATAAQGDATAALAAASSAQADATQALADAATAQGAADAAGLAAAAAQGDATQALADAATAQTTANGASAAASAAQADATQALANASAAQADADTALAGLAGKQDTIAPGTAGNLAVSTGSGWVSTSTATLLFGRSSPFFVECITDPAATGLARSVVGTGQISASTAYSADHPGQWNMIIGSGTASRAALFLGPSVGGLITPTGLTSGEWEVMFQVPTASSGGQTFDVLCGNADSPANSLVFNGVYFYVTTANNLVARRTVGGANTDTAIGAFVAGAWYRMRTTITGGNTVLSYAQTSNRNAPLTTVLTTPNIAAGQSPQIKIIRQSGATARTLTTDYFAWYFPNT